MKEPITVDEITAIIEQESESARKKRRSEIVDRLNRLVDQRAGARESAGYERGKIAGRMEEGARTDYRHDTALAQKALAPVAAAIVQALAEGRIASYDDTETARPSWTGRGDYTRCTAVKLETPVGTIYIRVEK